MTHEHPQPQQPHQKASLRNWVFWGFIAIAAFFLFSEHRAHALGALPFLLLLACPIMHIFMHRDHGKGHRHD